MHWLKAAHARLAGVEFILLDGIILWSYIWSLLSLFTFYCGSKRSFLISKAPSPIGIFGSQDFFIPSCVITGDPQWGPLWVSLYFSVVVIKVFWSQKHPPITAFFDPKSFVSTVAESLVIHDLPWVPYECLYILFWKKEKFLNFENTL